MTPAAERMARPVIGVLPRPKSAAACFGLGNTLASIDAACSAEPINLAHTPA